MNPNAELKYIIFDTGAIGAPVIFPPTISHDEMAQFMSTHLGEPKTAGYIGMDSGEIVCFGESMSLGIYPGEFDENIIRDYLLSSPKAEKV